jgi:hypothetical protein
MQIKHGIKNFFIISQHHQKRYDLFIKFNNITRNKEVDNIWKRHFFLKAKILSSERILKTILLYKLILISYKLVQMTRSASTYMIL